MLSFYVRERKRKRDIVDALDLVKNFILKFIASLWQFPFFYDLCALAVEKVSN